MKPLTAIPALAVVLGVFLAPAIAQKPKAGPEPGPEGDRMARMMTLVGEIQEQMKHEQVKGVQGMGPMQGPELQKLCPGAAALEVQKKGG